MEEGFGSKGLLSMVFLVVVLVSAAGVASVLGLVSVEFVVSAAGLVLASSFVAFEELLVLVVGLRRSFVVGASCCLSCFLSCPLSCPLSFFSPPLLRAEKILQGWERKNQRKRQGYRKRERMKRRSREEGKRELPFERVE